MARWHELTQREVAFRAERHDYELDKLLRPFIENGSLHPRHGAYYDDMVALARENPERAKRLLAFVDAATLPPQGITTPPRHTHGDNGRSSVIVTAMREFKYDERHAKVTTIRAFVNSALRDKSLAVLGEDEVKEMQIA